METLAPLGRGVPPATVRKACDAERLAPPGHGPAPRP